MDISIASLEQMELDEYASMFSKVFAFPPWNEQWSHSNARKRLESLLERPGSIGLKAVCANSLCGFLIGEKESWNNQVLFLVKEICVDTTFQRTGVGRKLMKELDQRLTKLGVKKMYLITERGSPAEAFYESLGFDVRPGAVVMSKNTDECS